MLHPRFEFDSGFQQLGLSHIAFAIVREMEPHPSLPDEYLPQLDAVGQWALDIDESQLETQPVLRGYLELLRQVGRSPMKFPPSARTLINIIKRRGRFPRILPVVDIYNVTALTSCLSLGVHDLSKLKGPIQFRISPGGETFYPIGGGEKTTARGDYVYADSDTVLAWLDARDSDRVKVTDQTRDILIVVQGNLQTSLVYRTRALEELCQRLLLACGGTAMLGQADICTGTTHWQSLEQWEQTNAA